MDRGAWWATVHRVSKSQKKTEQLTHTSLPDHKFKESRDSVYLVNGLLVCRVSGTMFNK